MRMVGATVSPLEHTVTDHSQPGRQATLEHDPHRRSTEQDQLLSVEQVAERLGTPTRFVRRLIAQRRIRFCRVGRYVRVSTTDLAEFIDAGYVEPIGRGRRALDR